MTAATLVKRLIVIVIMLVMLGFFALAGVTTYYQNSPEARERLELSVKSIEDQVDEETGFWSTLSMLVAAWWESDELVEEAKREKSSEAKASADRRREEEASRFNDSQYDASSDYYPNGS